MTYSNPPYPPSSQPVYGAPAKTSGLAIAAFICSLLICVPGITSAVGFLLAIPAIIVTSKSNVRGRGLAIAALLLGIVGLGAWGTGVVYVYRYAFAPNYAASKFSIDVAKGDTAGASGWTMPPFDNSEIPSLTARMQSQGKFIGLQPGAKGRMPIARDVNGKLVYDTAGMIMFEGGRQSFSIYMELTGDGWKVTKFDLSDLPASAPSKGMEDFSDKPPVPPTQPARP